MAKAKNNVYVILDRRSNRYAAFDGVNWFFTPDLKNANTFPSREYAKECFKVGDDHLILPYSIEEKELLGWDPQTKRTVFNLMDLRDSLHNLIMYFKSIARDQNPRYGRKRYNR